LIYHVFIKLLLENFEGKRQKSGLFKVLYTDLSTTRKRPALILANLEGDDIVI
jgi:hypothetical protein